MEKLQNLSSIKLVPPFQKKLLADVLQNSRSKKLQNVHRKTTALESLFNKGPSGLQLY